ncbi:MAG: hypothetical protein PHS64_07665, partial [Candidatus Omnitrophica bacterium]|nr:hypothetical protein [Candidatus Omnitrophota bacterium]
MAKINGTYIRICLITVVMLMAATRAFCSGKPSIIIHAQEEKGTVNAGVFGTNFIAYDPNTYERWPHEFRG